ncbi:hypothetical protein WJX75_007360 [Coccomyxa subellipsoidea]|uniref:HTH three-helical bundle domain-containing protein n=1 Tax=Coccomyxa subellipsoidea TaxID=248742 RepID=A0ABR2YJQ3_9CHLO
MHALKYTAAPHTTKGQAGPTEGKIARKGLSSETMDDKFCSLLEAACEASKHHEPQELMEFGVVKTEERVIKRGRITLQYLYDNLQKGQGTTLESAVRRDIGNTPDTSKALRMLVNARKIIRKGRGGRIDPFLYEIPSCVVEEIMATESEDDLHAQVYMSDGAAQEQKQEAPVTDQHASQRASDTAAAISGGAAMRPPLSPSSLIAEQQQPQPRQTCTISLDQGSFVSSLPINISALSRESRGPGCFTFSQALGACRKDYLGTSAGMLSCADRNAAEDQQMLHSSQDSMLSDGGTRSPKNSGSFLRMGCNVKLALSPPRFKPFGMSS